jgi:hypothetical protein
VAKISIGQRLGSICHPLCYSPVLFGVGIGRQDKLQTSVGAVSRNVMAHLVRTTRPSPGFTLPNRHIA